MGSVCGPGTLSGSPDDLPRADFGPRAGTFRRLAAPGRLRKQPAANPVNGQKFHLFRLSPHVLTYAVTDPPRTGERTPSPPQGGKGFLPTVWTGGVGVLSWPVRACRRAAELGSDRGSAQGRLWGKWHRTGFFKVSSGQHGQPGVTPSRPFLPRPRVTSSPLPPLGGEGEDAPCVQGLGSLRPEVVARESGDNERTRRAQGPCWPRGLLPAVGEGQVAGAGWRWGFPGRSRAGYPDYPAAANAFFFRAGAGRFPPLGMRSRAASRGTRQRRGEPMGAG